MSTEQLLSRLDSVRRTGEGRWVCRCPAHEDRGPSLSVREVADGRTLVHCFAGCSTADVLAAIGATWAEICPPRDRAGPGRRLPRERVTLASDALRCLAVEARVLVLAAGDLARGRVLSEADRQRLVLAAQRITRAEGACHA